MIFMFSTFAHYDILEELNQFVWIIVFMIYKRMRFLMGLLILKRDSNN